MALPIFQVDYSPIYNAFNALRGAKRTQLAEQQRKQDIAIEVLQAGLQGAELVYNAVQESKLAQAKKEAIEDNQTGQKKASDAVQNLDYEIISTPMPGRPEIPYSSGEGQQAAELSTRTEIRSLKIGAKTGDFETWFNTRQQEIEDKYKGFPQIRSWALDQLYASYDTAKRVATETLSNKSMRDIARIEQEQISTALDSAIRFDNFTLVEAAIGSARSLSPDVKTELLGDSRRQYDLGIQGKQLRETVGAQGYTASIDLINGWEGSGQVNAEQAENFRKMALGSSAVITATFQAKAIDQFYQATANGQDPEAAMQSVLQGVPKPYQAQIEKLVRADYESRMRIEDEKADKEMWLISKETPSNGAALLLALYNPENHYARRMDTNTFDKWEKRALDLMEAAKPGQDPVSSLYSRMYDAVDRNANPALEVSIREIDETTKDSKEHQALLAKRNELQKSYESRKGSTREEVLLEGYNTVFNPNMSVAAKQKWIDERAKSGGGLSAEDARKLRSWIDPYNEDPHRKEAMDALTSAYRLSMANPNLGTQAKKDLELELYHARNAMQKLFENPRMTKADIDAAIWEFLTKRATADLQDLVKQTIGERVEGFATGELRGTYRQATIQEYLREQGALTGETAARFPQQFQKKAEQLEKDALKKAGLDLEFSARLSSGDMIYSTKPIARAASGKLLMSKTGEQGMLYQVRYQIKNKMYVPIIYTQNLTTGVFDEIFWEWE